MKASIFEIFKIGIGPSSSHTIGPMRAAREFASLLQYSTYYYQTAEKNRKREKTWFGKGVVAERKLLAAADGLLERGIWTRKMHSTFRNIVVLVRDTGMRNKKELFGARIEDIDWNNRVFFFIPDSKTDNGRRFVPLSDRALELLKARCGDRREGWIFTAFSASRHLTTVDRKFRQARSKAGLPEKLVLYCGRHDYEPGFCRAPAIKPWSCAPWGTAVHRRQ